MCPGFLRMSSTLDPLLKRETRKKGKIKQDFKGKIALLFAFHNDDNGSTILKVLSSRRRVSEPTGKRPTERTDGRTDGPVQPYLAFMREFTNLRAALQLEKTIRYESYFINQSIRTFGLRSPVARHEMRRSLQICSLFRCVLASL